MKIRIGIAGLRNVQSKIQRLDSEGRQKLDEVVERRALEMVNETRERAPRLTGRLANSIDIIDPETRPLNRTYGSNVEYARRQEFEHKTKKGYFRKTAAKHRPLFFKDVRDFLNKWLGR